jgi:hypothetical protein
VNGQKHPLLSILLLPNEISRGAARGRSSPGIVNFRAEARLNGCQDRPQPTIAVRPSVLSPQANAGPTALRPAYEDLLGAGAIIDSMPVGSWSPEAQAAASVFRAARGHVRDSLMESASGRELIALGFATDVQLASELDVSSTVAVFQSGAYITGVKPRQSAQATPGGT